MRQIWKREYPFLAVATLHLFQEGVPPHLYKGGTPHSHATRGGWGIMLLKNRSGGGGTSPFWERGVPPCKKRGPYPPKPSAGKNIPSDDNSTRSTGFGNVGKGGGMHPLMPGQGGGGIVLLKNWSGDQGTSRFWERGVPPRAG